jgi:hypothetical protein
MAGERTGQRIRNVREGETRRRRNVRKNRLEAGVTRTKTTLRRTYGASVRRDLGEGLCDSRALVERERDGC